MRPQATLENAMLTRTDDSQPQTMISQCTIEVRPFRELAEMDACVNLQQMIWGYSDRDIIPARVFLVASHCNAQVLGAFDGDLVVGFALGFLGSREQRIYLHSHIVGVHPEYQNRGVGRQLKLAQRTDALARGIDLIEWTFDPLQARNAYFNLVRLGAVVRTYIPNFYGNTSSPLHGGLPTDRFVAEWWLRSPHVLDRIENKQLPKSSSHEIAMPLDMAGITRTDPVRAQQIQNQLKSSFEQSFAAGYAATGLDIRQDQAIYLLEHYED
jgi:predicted GNAT superfamily acetyltransferase